MTKKYEKISYDELYPGKNFRCRIEEWYHAPGANAAFFPHCVLDTVRTGRTSVRHIHYPYLSIEMVLSGELTYFREQEKVRIGPGEVFLCLPGGTSGFYSTDSDRYEKLTLLIRGSAPDLLLNALHLNDVMKISPLEPAAFERRFREIQQLLHDRKPGMEQRISELGMGMLLMLSREVLAGEQRYPDALRRALDYLHGVYTRCSVSLTELAQHTGVSPATLGRLFARYCGKTPMAYVTMMRMELAKNLLRTSAQSIKEIAVRTGYENPLYFSSAFRHYTGLSPKVFRCNYRIE